MFLCSLLTFAQFSGSGSGTENDPYLILNPIQLNQLRNFLNTSGVYFKMMADVDLTEFLEDENPSQGWQPVGNSSSACFKGILDGNGKTITGLWMNRPNNDCVGFFGYTSGATIKNVNIEANIIVGNMGVGGLSGVSNNSTFSSVSFSATKIQGNTYIGGLIGNTGDKMTLIDNVVTVTINATGDYVGGLIGLNNAGTYLSISGCKVNDSKIIGNDNVGGACGGITGNHSSTNIISASYIHADITGNNKVGGICGYSENYYHTINMSNCGYIGNINGASYIGGLAGYVKNTYKSGGIDSQTNCFAIGSITATGDEVGGLIGYDEGYNSYYCNNITNCYFSGSVSGKNYSAGLVGYKKYGTISNSYCSASVLGGRYVGGLVGYNESSLKTSVAINTRVMATEGDVHRLVGYNNGTIAAIGSTEENKSYNRTIIVSKGVAQDIEDSELNGTSVSKTTLKLKATYVAMGWDFTNVWDIQETECHPYMKTQTAPPVIMSSVKSGATVVSGKCVDGGTITLEIDGEKQQLVSTGNTFSFDVSPLQAGHEIRVSAKAEGKEQSYFTTELVSFLGKGTEADPYQVYTAADLTCVYRKGYYKQMNDIDLTSYINQFSPTEGWQSIGRDGSETIHFDGDGHQITGLWCNSTRDNTGLFSCFANGTIKNLTVKTANGKQVKGGANTGILIGKMMNGTIENCAVSGTVADATPVGGMVGLMEGGGLYRCQASVNITTQNDNSYVGGLVGEMTSGEIDQCYTTGTLTGSGTQSFVGGLVGKNYATITNCYSEATVTSSYNAAGLVAYNYALVDKCYATGNLFSNNYAAGIIGYNDGENAIVKNCVAMNNLIEVVYESQQVQQGGGYGQRIIGGIKNNAPAPEMDNYALKTMQVSVNGVAQKVYNDIMNGTAKEEPELMSKETYALLNWDFINIWDIDTGISYPYLRNIGIIDNGQSEEPGGDDPIVNDEKNALVLDNLSASPGGQIVLPINMNNEDEITAIQFDLYLPSGVTIAEDTDGALLIDLADRTTYSKHALSYRLQEDGAMRIVCFSNNSSTFTGNEGTVINVTLNVSSTIEDKDYVIAAKNIELSSKNGVAYLPRDAKATLSINSFMLGDVDGNGRISINDVVCIVNYILGKPNLVFIEPAADVDGSGRISINDVVVLINDYILGNNTSSHVKRNAPAIQETTYSHLLMDDITMLAGETRQIEVKMQSDVADIKAMQCDIYLPQGVEFVSCEKGGRMTDAHSVIANIQNDGALRVIGYSGNNESFRDNHMAVFTFTIRAAGDIPTGIHNILLSNIELSNGVSIISDNYESMLNIVGNSVPSYIEKVGVAESIGDVYNLNGQLVKNSNSKIQLPSGVYVINGKKVVISR